MNIRKLTENDAESLLRVCFSISALKVGERSVDEHHMILEFDGRHMRMAS